MGRGEMPASCRESSRELIFSLFIVHRMALFAPRDRLICDLLRLSEAYDMNLRIEGKTYA